MIYVDASRKFWRSSEDERPPENEDWEIFYDDQYIELDDYTVLLCEENIIV